MEKDQRSNECYSLPYIIHSSYRVKTHVALLFTICMCGICLFIPNIFFSILGFVLGLFLMWAWVYMGILKKAFIELTEDEIKYKTLFGQKTSKWTDIANVETYCTNNNTFIGIISNEKLENQKTNFLTTLFIGMGGGYSLSISLASFSKAEPEKLYSTIFYKVKKEMELKESREEFNENYNKEENSGFKEVKEENTIDDGSYTIAFFKAFIGSLILGIIYGVLIYEAKINFLLIPIIGIVWIFYSYSKSCRNKNLNIINKLLIGVLCGSQIYVGLVVALMMLNSSFIERNGILNAISTCIENIFENPEEYIKYHVIGICFFFLGALNGYSSKTIRKIKKITMRKQNGFYIKREQRYISIYLIDYADYNDKEEKLVVQVNPGTCLIEKEQKNILAYYIPEQVISDFNINIQNFKQVFLNEKTYYKLNLGGNAKEQIYGYRTTLILNKNSRNIELIQLEID